ncbi:MAG: FAD-dependent oxidoreductase [Methanobrevibacter sp.]|nr:FAD-dependent oxidoreductase [Methanobrevibacter sp.]
MKVVIVGGGAGGISTASNLRKLDEEVEIVVLTRDNKVSYSPCAIPYVLSDRIHSFDDIVMRTVDDYKAKNIDIMLETEVTAVDSENKQITYSKDGVVKTMNYDKLVLATGGSPFVPPMKGVDLDGVFKIRTLDDGKEVKEWSKNCKSALVTGAGLIGIEIAYAFKQMGLKVTLCEMLPQIVPRSLDPDMAKIITDYLIEEGIDVVLGQPITELRGEDGKVKTAVFDDGSEADADLVILATGVRAELGLAKMAGCDIGRWAILVNDRMATSVPDVYAVGDCVESYSAILRSNTVSQLGTTAVRQAKTLAQTLAGKRSRFNPVLNSMVSKVGKLEFGAVGLTRSFAQQNSIKAVVEKVEALTRARYYPNAKPMNVKVICDADGTIIGCQIIAEERVAERIDTMTLAITQELTCFELSNMEFAYAPPVSMVTDPLVLAVEEVSKKFDN